MFLFTLILVLLMAINYQSNLIYGLTFWLGTLFVVTIHFTHANLSGLKVMAMGAQPSFAGKQADFVLRLSGEGRVRHCVRLSWVASELPVQREVSPEHLACEVNVLADRVAELSLPYPLVERGWCTPGRLRIETDYPLGLLRCWSFLTLDQRAMAWPQPAPSDRSSLMSVDDGEGASQRLYPSDDQDLAGFRDYRPGDRVAAVDWRSLARGQSLQVATFQQDVGDPLWLDWDALPAQDPEQKLSQLCTLALMAHSQQHVFGLRLPSKVVPPMSGQAHLEHVLNTLALFDQAPGAEPA